MSENEVIYKDVSLIPKAGVNYNLHVFERIFDL